MEKFLAFLSRPTELPHDTILEVDRGEMRAVAEAARARLEEQGLFEVELDAQKEIAERVRAAREGREE